MSEIVKDEAAPKTKLEPASPEVTRNFYSGIYVLIVGCLFISSISAQAWNAAGWYLASVAVIWGVTAWGKAWRVRYGVVLPGAIIVGAAITLLILGNISRSEFDQAAVQREFAKSGEQHLAKARAALAAGDAAGATAALKPIEKIANEEITILQRAAKELERTDGDTQRAARRLMSADPEHDFSIPMFREAATVINAAEVAQIDKESAKQAEQERIMAHFSKRDGSHPAVVAAVKSQMYDPESFKHVETTAAAQGDVIIVSMTYRGTNAFGGTVTNHAAAVVDTDGKLHSLMTGR